MLKMNIENLEYLKTHFKGRHFFTLHNKSKSTPLFLKKRLHNLTIKYLFPESNAIVHWATVFKKLAYL